MNDTIYRQDAIDAVKMGALSAATLYGRTDKGSTALYETIRAIKALPSAQPEQQWIPCSERLPEEEEDFLVTDGESMAVGYYRQDAKAWDSADFGWIENREKGYGINEVIAWMPLPEPWRGEEDGEKYI